MQNETSILLIWAQLNKITVLESYYFTIVINGVEMKKNYSEQLAFFTHSPLLRWFITIYGVGETKYAGKTHKTGKLPTNSHFRSQEINLLLCYIMTFSAQIKTGNCPKTDISLNNKASTDSGSYFSVLLCCGVR